MSDSYCQEKGRLLVETKGGKRHVMRKSYTVKCTVLPAWTQDAKAHNFRMAAPRHTVQLGAQLPLNCLPTNHRRGNLTEKSSRQANASAAHKYTTITLSSRKITIISAETRQPTRRLTRQTNGVWATLRLFLPTNGYAAVQLCKNRLPGMWLLHITELHIATARRSDLLNPPDKTDKQRDKLRHANMRTQTQTSTRACLQTNKCMGAMSSGTAVLLLLGLVSHAGRGVLFMDQQGPVLLSLNDTQQLSQLFQLGL